MSAMLLFGISIYDHVHCSKSQTMQLVCITCMQGHTAVMSVLLKGGADVSIRDAIGKTALDMAKLCRQSDAVELLEQWQAQ
jgi:ankyrin repeat protein